MNEKIETLQYQSKSDLSASAPRSGTGGRVAINLAFIAAIGMLLLMLLIILIGVGAVWFDHPMGE